MAFGLDPSIERWLREVFPGFRAPDGAWTRSETPPQVDAAIRNFLRSASAQPMPMPMPVPPPGGGAGATFRATWSSRGGQGPSPEIEAGLAAWLREAMPQAMQEAHRRMAEVFGAEGAPQPGFAAPAPPPRPTAVPPKFELGEELAAACGDCAICLEELRAGQSCRRAPCLHVHHEACLANWLRGHSSCPVCKLDLSAPCRELRFRLKELESLAACELRYLATYLGIEVQRGAERPELELNVFSSSRVRVLCRRDELRALPVAKLKGLLRSAGLASKLAGLAEKGDIVDALLASGRYVEEAEASSQASGYGPAGAGPPRRARAAPY